MSQWSFDPIWNNAWLAVLCALGLSGLLLWGPRFGGLSPARQRILAALRMGTILLLLLALLRPAHVFTDTKPRSSVLVLLFDLSRSMQLPDRAGGKSRWEAEKQALVDFESWRKKFSSHLETRVYGYDGTLHPLDSASLQSLPAQPQGEATDIGAALEESLRRESGRRLAGVLLWGDGSQTAFNSGVESPTAAKRLHDEFAAPLYATAFGPPGDTSQAKDVALERLDEQYTVFVKNEVMIRGRVKISGYVNQAIPLEARLTDAQGKTTVIGNLSRTARQDGESLEFHFPYMPQVVGHYKITVEAAAQEGELVTKNNALSAYLNVLEGGLRVLLIDSGKRPEFKFLKRSLSESPDIELDTFVVDSLNRKSWPVNLAPVLQQHAYDVILLGNVPAAALGEENQALIAQTIEKGKGLLAFGGVRAFGAGNYYRSKLAEVLPLQFERYETQTFEAADRPDLFLNGPLAPQPVGEHPLLQLSEQADGEQAWRQLPPLDFANKFTGVKKTPGVRVLLAGPNAEPLLVSGEYGGGRVLAFAGESTYRWVLGGFAPQHKRFWRQAILWLARRDETQNAEVWIKLAQRRFQPGANVPFQVGARSPEGEPLARAQFNVDLVGPEGRTQVVRVAPGKEHSSGNLQVKTPGDYALEVTATYEGRTLGKTRAEFFVFDQDIELSSPAADHEHLARLAAITKDSGGRLVPAEELPRLLESIAQQPPEMEVRQEKWRFGDKPLAAWLWLLTLATTLGCEWWLRKKWGLV